LTTKAPTVMDRRRRMVLFGMAGLGLVAYLLLVGAYSAWQTGPALLSWNHPAIAAALALSLLSFVLRFWRWSGLMRALGHRLPVWRHFLCYLSGFALTTTPGKAGEALRGFYLRRHGVAFHDSVAAFIAERLMDVMALCLLGALLVAQQPQLALAAGLLAMLCVASGVLFTRPRFTQWLSRFFQARQGRLATLGLKLAALLERSSQLLSPLRLLGGIGIGSLAWGAQGLGLFFLGQAAGIIWGPGLALGIYAAGLLASLLVFFMPGGLGGTELAMVGLLKLAGTSAAVAVPLTLLSQLVNLWFAVLLGLAAALFLSFRPPLSSPEPLLP